MWLTGYAGLFVTNSNKTSPMKRNLIAGVILASMAAMQVSAAEAIKLTPDNIDAVVAAMTLEEKAHLVVGAELNDNKSAAGEVGYTRSLVPGAAGTTYPVERLGIPPIVVADGPAGLRISPKRDNDSATYYCTGFPVGIHLGATWNDEILNRVGQAMGNEVREYGVDILLAPGVNIMRNPLCGRNFEYYSEDPLLAGKSAAAIINGIQSNGVGTSLKHFAANNQEINRLGNDARMSLRALREIYLRNFEIAVKESQPWTVMTSYNYINGRYTSEDKGLLDDILRGEWGYKGVVMTDWGGGYNPVAQIEAGNDMMMPGAYRQYRMIVEAVENGSLNQADLDKCVRRVLELIVRTPRFKGHVATNNPDLKAHARLTRDVASEGFVLLKNDNRALPLAADDTISLFGATSYDFIAGGSGSGDVNKAYVIDLRQGLMDCGFALNHDLDSIYLRHMARERSRMAPVKAVRKWYLSPLRPNEIADAYKLAGGTADDSDVAIITIGRNSGEGYDRHIERDFNLHIAERVLIKAVSREFHSKGKKVVVVLNVCGPVETASWRDDVDAILLCWEPGQEGGNSVADVMLGKVSPSGHLPVTFPVSYSDVSAQDFPVNVPETGINQSFENVCRSHKPYDIPNIDYTNYTEDIYVGYRHSATRGIKDAYPFGHGLTYTTFDLSDMKVKRHGDGFKVTCKIKNTGDRSAKQVVQLYSTELAPMTDRPAIELRAYKKTPELKPGESYTVELQLSDDDLATFSEKDMAWKVAKGRYRLLLGCSSADLPLSQTVTVDRDKLTPVNDVMRPVAGEIFITD